MKEKYVAPTLNAKEFHCPHCEVYAHQDWYDGAMLTPKKALGGGYYGELAGEKKLTISICGHCKQYSLWLDEAMLYPISSIAPISAEDMPQEVKDDYIEARSIVNISPRATSALLRLALQKLMVSLGEKGENLNTDIGNLVKKGLPVTIQEALDCVRVIGNNAVHPGELDLKDDRETAISLFDLVNMIVAVMITQPKEVKRVYEKIPKGAKDAIVKRDK
jgi:hypothetical protein